MSVIKNHSNKTKTEPIIIGPHLTVKFSCCNELDLNLKATKRGPVQWGMLIKTTDIISLYKIK